MDPDDADRQIITCAAVADAIDKVAVFLGDGHDDAAAEGVAEPIELHGESGQDELGSNDEQITPVSLFGGPGADELQPRRQGRWPQRRRPGRRPVLLRPQR